MAYAMPDFSGLEQRYGIPTGLLGAIAQQESGGNPNAVSPKGAQGLFQFMPPTAQQYGINPLDPQQASDGAARMVSDLARKYNGDIPSVLAAYNWGSGNLDRHGMAAAPPETQNYISSIMGRLPQQQMASNQNSGPLGQAASAVGNFLIPQAHAEEMSSDYSRMSDEQLMAEAAKQGVAQGGAKDYSALSDEQLMAEAQRQGIGSQAPPETSGMAMARNIGQGAESVLTGLAAPFDMLGGPIRAGMNAMGANVRPLGEMIRANSPWAAPSGPIADINRGVASALPSIAMGIGSAAGGFGPATTLVGETLASSPMKQMAAGAASGMAGGATERAGGGPVMQGLASLGAGAATFGGMAGLQGALERPSAGTDLMTQGKSLAADQGIKQTVKAQQRGQDILLKALNEEGITPEDIAVGLEKAKQGGLPVKAIDVVHKDVNGVLVPARQILGLADAAANMPGEGATLAAQAASRGQQASERIGGSLDNFLSNKGYYRVAENAVQQQEAAGPLYQQAFSENRSVESPIVDKVLSTPAGKQALTIARVKMQNDMSMMGERDPELTEQARDAGLAVQKGVAKGLNLRSLDYVKRAFDDMIGTSKKAGERDQVRILVGLKNKLLDALDEADVTSAAGPNSKKLGGGLYSQARATYATPARVKDALEQGRDFAKLDPEEITQFMKDKNVSAPEKQAFVTGARRALQDMMDKLGDSSSSINRLWKGDLRKRFEAMSPNNYSDFSNLMQTERNMAFNNTVLGRSGSMTNPREMYQNLINQSADTGNIGNVVKMFTNPKGAIIDAGINMLSESMKKATKSMNSDTAAEIMKYLTADPENGPALWRGLAQQKANISLPSGQAPTANIATQMLMNRNKRRAQ